MKKRILSLLLAFALVFGVFTPSAVKAEENAADLILQADKTSVLTGETINISVNISASAADIKSADIRLNYDSDKFEYISGSVPDAYSTFCTLTPDSDSDEKYISLKAVKPEEEAFALSEGVLFTVSFRAKKSGTGSFSVSAADFTGTGGAAVLTGGGLPVSVSVTDADPEETEETISVTVSAYDYTASDAGLSGASASGISVSPKTVTVPKEGATAEKAIKAAFGSSAVIEDSTWGPMLRSINGLGNDPSHPYSGWLIVVNGAFAQTGMSDIVLTGNEDIQLHYSLSGGPDIGSFYMDTPEITKKSGTDRKSTRLNSSH